MQCISPCDAERKLQPQEIPHQLYVQNYSTACSTCLCVRRWLFSISRELELPVGEQASQFIFYQAVEEVNRTNIRADGRLYELKALQDAKKAPEYLALARSLPGYGSIVFPHCACDSRKEGHVVPAVDMASLKLHACREDGTMESQTVELKWDTIERWESDEEEMAFCFQYSRPDKPLRWVKMQTPYVRRRMCSDRDRLDLLNPFVALFVILARIPGRLLRSDRGGAEN